MDYHNYRFTDASILIYDQDTLVSLLPANRTGEAMYSHQGLSYGGFLLRPEVKFPTVLSIVKTVLQYLHSKQVSFLILKKLPDYYATLPAQEIDYLMFLLGAKTNQMGLSSVIDLTAPRLPLSNLRKRGIKKAQKQGLVIKEEPEFNAFWNQILIPNLQQQHQVNPVHTVEEISLLAKRFPKNIRQFNVYHNGIIKGGATIFETQTTAHVQYISAGSDKQVLGTLDFLFNYLIEKEFTHKHYFDFGISTEAGGKQLNQGLLQWKEGFGARTCINTVFEIETQHTHLLNAFGYD